ncbi:hypothetical protein V0288_15170 [Pannus brasiliensis CCIBt3594]|uniref:Uncharacterized protein n=1 Tax=Pannus brasiliensis CCIBt3594 TaxID=1427578 RepID=A0AAW9QY62_9CHRO
MSVENLEKISDIFSIFHDGKIVFCHLENSSLLMEVEIRYLAERIDPAFRKFIIRLYDVKDLYFFPWPSDRSSEPDVLREIDTIFKPELEILDANCEEDQIKVICTQHSLELDYFGGELSLSATSAEVLDEAGKNYSIEELDTLCKSYWDEWANQHKA